MGSIKDCFKYHDKMSVCGCIDSYGAITAHDSKDIAIHKRSELGGKRWRWLVWVQEFDWMAPKNTKEANNPMSLNMTQDEYCAVCTWLVENQYADESILFQK